MTLDTTYSTLSAATPGAANSVRATLPPFPPIWLNEVLPNNFFLGTNGLADRFGERDPWVELYNGGTNALSLDGYALANNYTNLAQWPFPSNLLINPKQFLLVWLDGQPAQSTNTELHTSFRAAPDLGSVVLSKGTNLAAVIDHLNYNSPVAGRSYGSYPDGQVSGRRSFSTVTPNATNNPASAPITVFINEWMADNLGVLNDPADLPLFRYEDWFELFNPGANTVDLTGYFLSDTLTNTTQFSIPVGTIIPPRGYLLVWADNTPAQNQPTNQDIHANFSLAKSGEALALFAPDGTVIDAITFGPQISDVSQGRFPDGSASIYFLTNVTPRAANVIATANNPPTLAFVGNKTVNEGALLTFTAVATDTNIPAQTLAFSLDAGFPAGATINATNGLFAWTPNEAQGPGVYPVTLRVTDNGAPSMNATQQITITVNEVNNAPVLAPFNSRTVNELTPLTVTNSATDPDSPAQMLVFSLDAGGGAPTNMTIHPGTGQIQWTPTEAQGPGTYAITVRVTDNGEPALSDAKVLTVFVVEVNTPPGISFPTLRDVHAESLLLFTAQATDGDMPPQGFVFSLDPGAPPGATINPATGSFAWTPPAGAVGTNLISIRVEDTGSPRLSAAQAMTVMVRPALRAAITQNGNQISLSFPTIGGRSYRVDSKNSLSDPAWTPLGGSAVAGAASMTVQDNLAASPQRFYRVVQVN